MMPLGPSTRIYLAAGAIDLRKSFEGLSDLVRDQTALLTRVPSLRCS